MSEFTDNLLKPRVSMFLRLNPNGVEYSTVEQLADPYGDLDRGSETVDALIADGLVEQLGNVCVLLSPKRESLKTRELRKLGQGASPTATAREREPLPLAGRLDRGAPVHSERPVGYQATAEGQVFLA